MALKRRSLYDFRGRVIGDPMMGATPAFDPASGGITVRFSEDGDAHLWFPRYETVLHLILKSEIRKAQVKVWQAFLDDHHFICEPIPENEMFVRRAAPHDPRSHGQPISIVVDFTKQAG